MPPPGVAIARRFVAGRSGGLARFLAPLPFIRYAASAPETVRETDPVRRHMHERRRDCIPDARRTIYDHEVVV